MDIFKHNAVLLKWIRSCQTAQQLDLFTKLVIEFDATQFYDEIKEPYAIELVKKDLMDAIIERRVIIAGKRATLQFAPYHLPVPNDSVYMLHN
jgi:hypothetical protein